jgi:hypothetical protein
MKEVKNLKLADAPFIATEKALESYRVELLKRYFPTLSEPSSCTRMDRDILFVCILCREYMITTETDCDGDMPREMFEVCDPRGGWKIDIPLMANVDYEKWAMDLVEVSIRASREIRG